MTEEFPLDDKQVARLASPILNHVRAFQRERIQEIGPSREIVCEALNALAVAVSIVIAGTNNDPGARTFFDDALKANLEIGERLAGRQGQGAPAPDPVH